MPKERMTPQELRKHMFAFATGQVGALVEAEEVPEELEDEWMRLRTHVQEVDVCLRSVAESLQEMLENE